MNTHVCSHVIMIKTLRRVTLGVGNYEYIQKVEKVINFHIWRYILFS